MSKKRNEYALNDVVNTLNDNGVIILPTDTVYGLGVKYGLSEAKKRIYDLKGREFSKELPFVVNNLKMLEKIAYIDKSLLNKLKKYYPGPLTLIFKKKENVISSMDTIAVRMLNDEFINSVIKKIDAPLLLTSANRSGKPPIVDPSELLDEFDDEVDIIVMGKTLDNKASTIIDVSDSSNIKLIREGEVEFNEILELIKNT